MAALQLLAGLMKAPEGDGREEQAAAAAMRHAVDTDTGKWEQRQRVGVMGAKLHIAQPSNAAVQWMGVAAAVAALQAHVKVARIA